MEKRLSDTAALVKEGINSPGAKVSPFGGNSCHEAGADNAVARGHNPGRFLRETGAGEESLAGATGELKRDK